MRVFKAALVYQRENRNIASVYSIAKIGLNKTESPIIAISGSIDRCLSYCFGLRDAGIRNIETFIVDSFANDMSMHNWQRLDTNEACDFFVFS